MKSDLQEEALAVLGEIWELSPDIRLGQLFAHLGFLGEAHLGRSLGYIDDDEMLSILYRHRTELLARRKATSAVMCDGAQSGSSVAELQKPGIHLPGR